MSDEAIGHLLGVDRATWKIVQNCFVSAGPTTLASGSTLDVSDETDYVLPVLTENVTLVLDKGAPVKQGIIVVKQDATGGRTVTFSAPGWTLYRDSNGPDLVAASAANAITVYPYAFIEVAGTKMLLMNKIVPVAA